MTCENSILPKALFSTMKMKPNSHYPPITTTMEARSFPYSESSSFNSQTRVLIWNSTEKDAVSIEQTLHSAGYLNTFCAKTYDEGLQYLQDETVEVFLIDMQLGSIDSLRLVKALRDSHLYRYTPVLITTESHSVEDTLNAMKAGANDLIKMPMLTNQLCQKIELHLKVSSLV